MAGSIHIALGCASSDMIPNSLLARAYTRYSDERLSDELRAYLRDEWKDDRPALRPAAGRLRPRVGARVRRFLEGRIVHPRSATASSYRPVRAEPRRSEAVPLGPAADCEHAQTEYLGASGFTEFLRCLLCGAVFILQPGRTWRLRPSVP